jgi:hypothetical protein
MRQRIDHGRMDRQQWTEQVGEPKAVRLRHEFKERATAVEAQGAPGPVLYLVARAYRTGGSTMARAGSEGDAFQHVWTVS